jgi:hypothetical protein
VEGAVEVHREEPAPFVVRDPHERVERRGHAAGELLLTLLLQQRRDAPQVLAADGAGVVDEDVERSELTLDVRDGRVDRCAVAHVRRDGDPVPDGGGRSPGAVEVDVECGDPRSLGGKAQADRLADARGTAGDRRDLPIEPHHGALRSGTATTRPRTSPASRRS